MSKQAMTEILAAVANGEGAADTDTVAISLGALRALVRQEPVGFRWVEAESGKTDGLIYSGEPTRIGVQRAHQSEPREVPQYVYAAPVVARQAVPDVCRQALEDACVVSWISADLSTLEGAKKAINDLCTFEAKLAVDPAVNGGYALVPVEPTAEMIAAGWFNGDMACAIGHALAYADSVRDYKAMLAAAKKQGGAE